MKVFMLGWEFPPFISGGLGTACYGLTKAMNDLGIEVTFALPKVVDPSHSTHVKMLSPGTVIKNTVMRTTSEEVEDELKNVKIKTIQSLLEPYGSVEEYQHRYEDILRNKRMELGGIEFTEEMLVEGKNANGPDYAGDMYSEIHRYAACAVKLAVREDFDVIHAHDWMTYPAGMAVASITGKPLVVHVHSTEFDRSGEHVNQRIYDIERKGMHSADKIIAVSHLTRNTVITRYGILGEKVEVVHNGVDRSVAAKIETSRASIKSEEKIVLFLGRITMQKGPEYFLQAAKKVLSVIDNVKFVMAGSGDMMHRTIEMAAELGIGNKVLFTGFLRGDDVRKVYEMADLYVMPSVSEPFGIAPLEALNHDVPVLISKQSGVSEVLTHALKVDFWDVQEMANKIIAVLRYHPLQMTLREHGNFEVRKFKWEDAAAKCISIYGDMLLRAQPAY
ncbi:MAG: glycosyltransferase family 4 protein [Anaerohalosphaera sp.]|nr:glycosyltransferase family 4 protein [Anaerohalosphaera sp.]